MSKQKIILLDCETGGLECKENPITQIALVVYDSFTFKELDRFETYVKPYNNLKIEKKALEVTGITMSDVNRGMEIKLVVGALNTLCKKHTPKMDKGQNKPIIAGHNVGFDIGFLKYAYNYSGKNMSEFWYSSGEEIERLDTLAMAKHRWKQETENSSYNLTACLRRIGEEVIGAHKAMNDVLANGKLLQHFLMALRGTETAKKSNDKSDVEVLSAEGKDHRDSFEM